MEKENLSFHETILCVIAEAHIDGCNEMRVKDIYDKIPEFKKLPKHNWQYYDKNPVEPKYHTFVRKELSNMAPKGGKGPLLRTGRGYYALNPSNEESKKMISLIKLIRDKRKKRSSNEK